MADYKLRLDIDEKELQKKIERALKGANIDTAIFGGGGKGSSAGAKQAIKDYEKLQKISEKVLKNISGARTFKGEKKILDYRNQELKKILEIRQAQRVNTQAMERTMRIEGKRLSHMNALVRQGGITGGAFKNVGRLIGGRPGGALGTGFDLALSKVGFNQGKTQSAAGFLGPGKLGGTSAANIAQPLGSDVKTSGPGRGHTPVKIMGIVAGLAGAAGLGKMIIDSSPVLKAMLKLLNVGVMLILRPIGDFIGFMLRPLLIEFVKKVAIPAYRQGSKFARDWGTGLGKGLLTLLTNPAKFLFDAIVYPIQQWWDQNMPGWLGGQTGQFEDNPTIGGGLLTPELEEFLKADNEAIYKQVEKTQELISIQKDIFPWEQAQVEEQIKTNEKLDEIKTVFEQWNEAINKEEKALHEETFKIQEERMKAQFEAIGITAEEQAKGKPSPYGDYAKEFFECGGAGRPIEGPKITISDAAKRIIAAFENYKAGAVGSGTTPTSSTSGFYDVGGVEYREEMEFISKMLEETSMSYAEINEKMLERREQAQVAASLALEITEEVNQQLDSASQAEIFSCKTTQAYFSIMTTIEAAARWINTRLGAIAQQRTGEGKLTRSAKTAKKIINDDNWASFISKNKEAAPAAKEHGWMVTLKGGQVLRFPNIGLEPGLSKEARDMYKAAGQSVYAYAQGGIINEPILGIGRSGKKYSFGEQGPETITPGTGRGTTNITININPTGMREFDSMLKQHTLRILKESTSRTGIV